MFSDNIGVLSDSHGSPQMPGVKGSRKNNLTFYTPMHPAWRRCENSAYPDMPAFSRLARRALQRLKLRTYFCANPKQMT
jgi:hypothetical protein